MTKARGVGRIITENEQYRKNTKRHNFSTITYRKKRAIIVNVHSSIRQQKILSQMTLECEQKKADDNERGFNNGTDSNTFT